MQHIKQSNTMLTSTHANAKQIQTPSNHTQNINPRNTIQNINPRKNQANTNTKQPHANIKQGNAMLTSSRTSQAGQHQGIDRPQAVKNHEYAWRYGKKYVTLWVDWHLTIFWWSFLYDFDCHHSVFWLSSQCILMVILTYFDCHLNIFWLTPHYSLIVITLCFDWHLIIISIINQLRIFLQLCLTNSSISSS